jgi:transcriptional regulator NrdR family protein
MKCPDCGERLRVANVTSDADEEGSPFTIRSRTCENAACDRRLNTLEFPVEFSTAITTGGK